MLSFRLLGILLLAAGLILPTGCETMSEHKVASGAAIGAATGAVAGGIIGHQSGNKETGALIGAGVGALAGAGIGYALDRQADDFDKIEEVEVERHPAEDYKEEDYEEGGAYEEEEPPVEHLTLRISSEVLFDKDSATLTPRGKQKVAEVAAVLLEYPDSDVLVKGYASSEGAEAYNLELSERRAKAVQNELIANRVSASRIQAIGFGEADPIASNETEAGRALNRRVEIDVYPRGEVQ
ncbi:MAG TPA: OmpA family protein [Candidatus Sumerlaeota bacterium]|nr:OmpA family protein [Candidatus Sumerlaeota bacterium]HOR28787.1 OmpA family protein [Candidatus Sumerlaeota bacterium]HPK03198.1 OmpA family protein [Candidatus Sumerlaeota bacterium]